jgi:hypothetical protein
MARFDGSRCNCVEDDCSAFDKLVKDFKPPSADHVINQSSFCTSFQLNLVEGSVGKLTLRDFLSGLKGKMGLYFAWRDEGRCDEHGHYFVQAIYSGKGFALNRVLAHVKNKFPNDQQLWVSFFECENLMAKFLEQAFLDTYAFDLNENENPGTAPLYGRWTEERFMLGTEMHHVSNLQNAPKSLDDL